MQIPASLRSDPIHIASERTIHIAGIRSNIASVRTAAKLHVFPDQHDMPENATAVGLAPDYLPPVDKGTNLKLFVDAPELRLDPRGTPRRGSHGHHSWLGSAREASQKANRKKPACARFWRSEQGSDEWFRS